MVSKIRYVIFAIIACLLMAVTDAYIQPPYAVKSAIKVVLFLVFPLIFAKKLNLLSLFSFDKKAIKISLLLGFSLLVFILGAYFLIGSLFDLSAITSVLGETMGVNAGNFGFVAIYIALINSLLEEFFFRGFCFLKISSRYSGVISALLFSLYHVAMMIGWFDIFLFLLIILALFIAGIIFNAIDKKFNSIYPSYFIHMFANIAINTIGFILFSM